MEYIITIFLIIIVTIVIIIIIIIPCGGKQAPSLTNDSNSSYAWQPILVIYDSCCTAGKCRESSGHSLSLVIISGHMSIDQEIT